MAYLQSCLPFRLPADRDSFSPAERFHGLNFRDLPKARKSSVCSARHSAAPNAFPLRLLPQTAVPFSQHERLSGAAGLSWLDRHDPCPHHADRSCRAVCRAPYTRPRTRSPAATQPPRTVFRWQSCRPARTAPERTWSAALFRRAA